VWGKGPKPLNERKLKITNRLAGWLAGWPSCRSAFAARAVLIHTWPHALRRPAVKGCRFHLLVSQLLLCRKSGEARAKSKRQAGSSARSYLRRRLFLIRFGAARLRFLFVGLVASHLVVFLVSLLAMAVHSLAVLARKLAAARADRDKVKNNLRMKNAIVRVLSERIRAMHRERLRAAVQMGRDICLDEGITKVLVRMV
jgi:hypothetical protein